MTSNNNFPAQFRGTAENTDRAKTKKAGGPARKMGSDESGRDQRVGILRRRKNYTGRPK